MPRSLNQSRILITGVQGQVGFELLKSLSTCGAELILASRRGKANDFFGYRTAHFDLSDLKGIQDVIADVQPDIVINPAAYTAVDKAEEDRLQAFEVNEKAVHVMGEALKKSGGALIHFSTDYVYNSDHHLANTENSPTNPGNVYAASKLAGEQALASSGVPHLILRTSWVYGINGNNFVKTMLKLGRERESLRIVDDQIGSPTSAVTLAQVVSSILCQGTKDPVDFIRRFQGIYNVSDSGYTSWYLFAEEIFRQARELGIDLKIREVEGIRTSEYKTPAQRPLNSRLSLEKIGLEFGVKTPDWQRSLALFLYQSHINLI